MKYISGLIAFHYRMNRINYRVNNYAFLRQLRLSGIFLSFVNSSIYANYKIKYPLALHLIVKALVLYSCIDGNIAIKQGRTFIVNTSCTEFAVHLNTCRIIILLLDLQLFIVEIIYTLAFLYTDISNMFNLFAVYY